MIDLGLILAADEGDRRPDLRFGVVTQVSPLMVRIGSPDGAPATKLAAYSPANGHVVVVLLLPGLRVVLGNIG